MTKYLCKSWVSANAASTADGMPDVFVKMLKKSATFIQEKYQSIMEISNGSPVGIELKAAFRESWAFISEEMSDPQNGAFRIQYFDEKGFSNHFTLKTAEDALEACIKEGFHIVDKGALDRVSETEIWKFGLVCDQLRSFYNSGQISWVEMLSRMRASSAVEA